jgi:outer membrane protein
MKKFSIISNIVLFVAVVVLYVLHFSSVTTCCKAKENEPQQKTFSSKGALPIAYVNVDSLLSNYTFAKDANQRLLSKGESSRATLNAKAKVLQGEMMEFQRKVQNNAFLSRDRAEQEQARLVNKQRELENLDKTLTQELMKEQQKLNEQMRDTIDIFLKQYNKGKNIQIIFSNTMKDNILYANKTYDITKDVIKELNERYEKK